MTTILNILEGLHTLLMILPIRLASAGTIFFLGGGGGGKNVDMPSDCQILGGYRHIHPIDNAGIETKS